MSNKNISKILLPHELKLLVCGESTCSIDQMKKFVELKSSYDDDSKKQMFWNVMNSFSVKERMLFIRFVSGNLGLHAPELKWDKLIQVDFESINDKEDGGHNMVVE